MKYMNTYDIELALETALRFNLPNLIEANYQLIRLVNWTNSNSDGWAYWPKPCRAAKSLMELIETVDPYGWEHEDIDESDLKRALTPIKSFFTRHGTDWTTVLATQGSVASRVS